MKLLDLQNGETKVWEEKGYLLPKYDRQLLRKLRFPVLLLIRAITSAPKVSG